MRSRLLREPLVHFLLLGLALFAIGWLRGDSPSAESRRIVITPGRVEQLATMFTRTWQRPPTRVELDGLVEEYVKEEVYYRQARVMGLDEDDTIIRRRLRQKLEFMTDAAAEEPPTEAELVAFLAEREEVYRIPPRLALRHIYFSVDRRGDAAAADAEALLRRLPAGRWPEDGSELGDPLLLELPQGLLSPHEISRLLGSRFAEAVETLPVGAWSGPVESGFGLHLVLVTERVDGRAARLEEVRGAVERDWLAERRELLGRELYEELRRQYEVVWMGEDGNLEKRE